MIGLDATAFPAKPIAEKLTMSDTNISILDGSTFLVSSRNGDIDAGPNQPHGLFYKDMRHLSKWKLTIKGLPLDVLSTDALEYYYAQHFCVPPTGTIYKNPTISIVRRRFVGDGFVEDLTVHKPKFATAEGAAMRRGLKEWIDEAPTVTCHPEAVRLYMRSLVDVAALRFRPDTLSEHSLPAAGLPWFMALFGRDSLITSYQMLPFAPELAATTLHALADAQGKKEDKVTEEEPGRILHELRFGELTHFGERPQRPYYGASDTTPLFLVLLDEYERWTGDAALVKALEPNARAALNWIDKFGDRDGDGYIEYERKTELGLDNQCWKDSWNSILFADGTLAPTPRATCEIQGYAYDAKVRTARLAREIWKDEELATKLEKEAKE